MESITEMLELINLRLIEPLLSAIANSWLGDLLNALNMALNSVLNIFRQTPITYDIINVDNLTLVVGGIMLAIVITITIKCLVYPFQLLKSAILNLDITNDYVIETKNKKGKKKKWKKSSLKSY